MPMNLADVMTQFSTDDRCRELLRRLRWPAGVECPRCKQAVVELETEKELFYCKDCDYQFSVTVGSIFNDSHLPLTKWFMATLLLCEAKKGMSACQVQRTLGISYKTAWYLCHRIRAAMAECDKPMMDGKLEVDETYVGGRGKGLTQRGRGTKKRPVIGILQRNGDLRLFHAKNVTGRTIEKFLRQNVGENVEMFYTDDLNTYRGIARRMGIAPQHKVIRHRMGEYVRGDVYTNGIESAFSLFKRGLRGSWHKISPKHLQAYLEEMTFRFNRRKKSDLFLDTLRHMVTAQTLTYEKLTA